MSVWKGRKVERGGKCINGRKGGKEGEEREGEGKRGDKRE